MLVEQVRSSSRTVLLQINSEGLRLFLTALLDIWQYSVVTAPVSGCLALLEGSLSPPSGAEKCLRFTNGDAHHPDQLTLPVKLETLWGALEQHFHRPPRNHLRMAVHLPASVSARNDRWEVLLHSLSDAGARFRCRRELVKGENLSLSWVFNGEVFTSQAQIIYSFPTSDNAGESYDTGVIFTSTVPSFGEQLSDQIILRYLEAVRTRVPSWSFTTGLALLDLPPALHRSLEGAAV